MRRPRCVVICPQAFGGDRLESLVIPLLSSGISVMTYHPRGMWDGVHEYTSISALDDACAAVDFLQNADAPSFTKITDVVKDPRVIQFALKLNF